MPHHSARSSNPTIGRLPQKLSLAKIMAWAIIIVFIVGCSPSTATPIVKVGQFTYQVRVQATDTGKAISNAIVIVEVPGKTPVNDITDATGLARVFVPSSLAGQPGVIIVEATDYATYREHIDLTESALPDLVLLKPLPVITDTPTPTPEPTPTPTRVASLTTDTPTPVQEPSPAPTDTPVPTDTLSPVPTGTPLPTDTAAPVPPDTPTPTGTPTPTPARMPTPAGAPSSTPTRTLTLAPSTGEFTLLKPKSEELTYGRTEFEWQWNGQLAENQGFEVRLWRDGEPEKGVHDAVEDNMNGTLKHLGNNTYSLVIDIAETAPVQGRSGEYNWTVLLVQVTPEYKDLGIQAPPGRLRFEPSGDDGDNGVGIDGI